MSDLTEQQQAVTVALAAMLCNLDATMYHRDQTDGFPCSSCTAKADALAPVVAHVVADAEQRGADRVTAAVEALATHWKRPLAGSRQRANTNDDFREIAHAEDIYRACADGLRATLARARAALSNTVPDSSRVDQATTAATAVQSLIDPNHGRQT